MDSLIYTKETKGRGVGVFATRNVKKGESISIFEGPPVVINSFKGIPKEVQDLLYPIGINQYLIAKEPTVRINHSCDPNAGLKDEVTLIAMRNIKKDEEVTFDYSTVTADEWELHCSCGAKSCRKVIRKYSDLDDEIKEKYSDYTPDWIK